MSRLSQKKATGTTKRLAPRFEKWLVSYAAAASAATGVALLASPDAEAKIVYTKTNTALIDHLALDLNRDGVPDFEINFCSCVPHGQGLGIVELHGNLVRGAVDFPGDAAALVAGAPIGPNQVFISTTFLSDGVFMGAAGSYVGYPYYTGPWARATNRYLGLKFTIKGEVHYGWARLSSSNFLNSVVLTGYAYETVPNKSLKAGQTSEAAGAETDDGDSVAAPVPQVPSLGLLARGADALEAWRRSPLINTGRVNEDPSAR